jgi:hypothetical protein
LIKLALLSAYIKNERPLSLLLSAPVEAGKTESIRMFAQNAGILYIADFTPTGFVRKYSQQIQTGQIKHILVPDLLSTLAKHYYSREKLITFLNSLTEEGLATVHTMFANMDIKAPHPIGLIGGVTKEKLEDSKIEWLKVGFLSRMLPVTWRYNQTTVREIMEYIFKRQYVFEQLVHLNPMGTTEVLIAPKEARKLEKLADRLLNAYRQAAKSPEDVYGFRYQRHFQRLAMASALEAGRHIVAQEDIDRVEDLSIHCNLDFNEA